MCYCCTFLVGTAVVTAVWWYRRYWFRLGCCSYCLWLFGDAGVACGCSVTFLVRFVSMMFLQYGCLMLLMLLLWWMGAADVGSLMSLHPHPNRLSS